MLMMSLYFAFAVAVCWTLRVCRVYWMNLFPVTTNRMQGSLL